MSWRRCGRAPRITRKKNSPKRCGRWGRSRGSGSKQCSARSSGVEQFASGPKRNYYGKGDIIAYRLTRSRDARSRQAAVFGANVTLLVYGDAFWPTYTTGDNTGLVATD